MKKNGKETETLIFFCKRRIGQNWVGEVKHFVGIERRKERSRGLCVCVSYFAMKEEIFRN